MKISNCGMLNSKTANTQLTKNLQRATASRVAAVRFITSGFEAMVVLPVLSAEVAK